MKETRNAGSVRPSKIRPPTRRAFCLTGSYLSAALATCGGPRLTAAANAPAFEPSPLRLALSERVVMGVSLNDARAALAVWSAEIGQAAGLKLAASQNLVLPTEQILAAIRRGTVDLFCVTVQEYRQVSAYVDTSRILADDFGGEQFVLAVREGGGITNLAGLRGHSLNILDAPSTSVAEPWLAVSFWREGQESPQQLLGRINHSSKLAQVVLPVFFGQADACLVTRRGLDLMFELNPQLARKLHVLLTSPKIANAFFACRKGYTVNSKKPIMDRLVEVRSSTAAKQVLTLFQSPGFAVRDSEYLNTANSVLDAYERHHEPNASKKN